MPGAQASLPEALPLVDAHLSLNRSLNAIRREECPPSKPHSKWARRSLTSPFPRPAGLGALAVGAHKGRAAAVPVALVDRQSTSGRGAVAVDSSTSVPRWCGDSFGDGAMDAKPSKKDEIKRMAMAGEMDAIEAKFGGEEQRRARRAPAPHSARARTERASLFPGRRASNSQRRLGPRPRRTGARNSRQSPRTTRARQLPTARRLARPHRLRAARTRNPASPLYPSQRCLWG